MTRSEIEDAWQLEMEVRRIDEVRARSELFYNGYVSAKNIFKSKHHYCSDGWVEIYGFIEWLYRVARLKTFREESSGIFSHFENKIHITGIGICGVKSVLRMRVSGV